MDAAFNHHRLQFNLEAFACFFPLIVTLLTFQSFEGLYLQTLLDQNQLYTLRNAVSDSEYGLARRDSYLYRAFQIWICHSAIRMHLDTLRQNLMNFHPLILFMIKVSYKISIYNFVWYVSLHLSWSFSFLFLFGLSTFETPPLSLISFLSLYSHKF